MIPFDVKKNYLIVFHRLIKPDLMKYFIKINISIIFKFHNIIRYYQIVHESNHAYNCTTHILYAFTNKLIRHNILQPENHYYCH